MNLYLFQHITKDPVIAALLHFAKEHDEASYFDAMRGLLSYSSHRMTDRNLLKEYLLRCMLEQEDMPDILHLRDFLRHDMKVIYHFFWETDWDAQLHELGLLPFSDISVPVTCVAPAGYAFSLTAMIDCTSNEALGGAILAHVESFGCGRCPA